MPGLTACSASPLNAYDAHRIPVPSLEPLDETDKTAPLCPVGPTPLNTTWLCGSNRLLARSNGMARNGSFSDQDRKSTRLNSSHSQISYAVFCLKKKIK